MAPRNGVYIVQGEMSLVVSALRRNARWGSHSHQDEEQDPLLHGFSQLKDQLSSVSDLGEIDVNTFLGPFLDVVRSEDTTGPITGVALSSVNKFLSYGLVDPTNESAASGIENLADAVTHARFVGTDPSSDEVVLMKILQVLRTLLLTPVGAHMTNESVCEIMQSCFRICFEIRLSELLRRSAEQTLMDMIQLLFSRLPQFKEEAKVGLVSNIRKVFKRAGAIATGKRKKHASPRPKRTSDNVQMTPQLTPTTAASTNVSQPSEPTRPEDRLDDRPPQSEGPADTAQDTIPEGSEEQHEVPSDVVRDEADTERRASASSMETLGCPAVVGPSVASQIMSRSDGDVNSVEGAVVSEEKCNRGSDESEEQVNHESVASKVMIEEDVDENKDSLEENVSVETEGGDESVEATVGTSSESSILQDEYVNPRGVRFMPQEPAKEGAGPLVPYGLPCVRELFRFLISLINPQDRHNSDPMIHMGLSLLTVALESGSHHIGTFTSLLNIVKDELCRNLFLLLQCEVLGLFGMSLRVCFLLFEGLRVHLKFQMEMFYKKLMEILAMDLQNVHYEKRELILNAINQLFRVPNLVTELYLNYDCDLYCTNVFEELCKLLSKNAFPAGSLYSVHILALDALLAVVQTVEGHCHAQLPNTAIDDSIPVEKTKKSGDDDSGTDENCDTPTMPSPPTSGYAMARKMRVGAVSDEQGSEHGAEKSDHEAEVEEKPQEPCAGGLLFTSSLPTPESLSKLKKRKKLLQAGSEQFNAKPKKGIEFLQEHGLLSTPLDPEEVAKFLRENPRLDKKTIGEFIGDKRNNKYLSAFVRSFHFHGLRVDEGLRAFLETFRLPGESPVIEHIMEFFSELFYECNPEHYANKDAVFTLAYAVIMLNVDQHNTNIKQQKPMTVDDFKRNLRKTNGGKDFAANLLEESYHAVKSEEIVMPAERGGRIRENYEWKVLLRRSSTVEGQYVNGMGSCFDQDLFLIIWGPTVAALSYVYDNGLEKSVVQKAIVGYRKCALISAHYNQCYVFDNLVISLCKFTALLTSETSDALPVAFGSNPKAQQSARTLFALAHRHGDILREGWKNIMDCMLQLFKAKLLPKSMIEAEDFVETSGKVNLLPEELPSARPDTTLMSWYQYFVSQEPSVTRGQTAEDKEAQRHARACIMDCHPELLITESKFLRFESLNELIKVLIFTSSIDHQESEGGQYDEEATVFFLELLIRVILQNRDRVSLLWHTIRDHLSNTIVSASVQSRLVERAVVGLLRLAIRLLRKEEISSQVLITLRVLLMMKVNVLQACGRQISYGLHELLRTNASSITAARDWITVFTLLECVGASVTLPTVTPGPPMAPAVKDTDNDSIAGDFELTDGISTSESDVSCIESESGIGSSVLGDSWLVITKEDPENSPASQYDLQVSVRLNKHDSKSFVKACQSLTFLIRDGAHVTKENFLQCIHAVRVFAEASLNGGVNFRKDEQQQQQHKETGADYRGSWGRTSKKSMARSKKMGPASLKNRKPMRSASSSPSTSEDEAEIFGTINNTYDAMSLQLIELMHALHTKAASFFDKSALPESDMQAGKESVEKYSRRDSNGQTGLTNGDQISVTKASVTKGGLTGVASGVDRNFLWTKCWCQLLQGIARSCCDIRKEVRMSALTFLQRALLIQDMQALTAMEWEACFNKVLFPMLTCLLEVNNPTDPVSLEETRMRATTLLCRVFLQHLTQLLSLSTFTALWLTILDFMDKYMHADKSDLLFEAIPESLKNMLLVMSTAGIFDEEECAITSQSQSDARRTHRRSDSDVRKFSALWQVTWERIDCFLPNLKQELFTPRSKPPQSSSPQAPPAKVSTSPAEPTKQPEQVKCSVPEETSEKPDTSSGQSSSPSHSITSPPSGGQQVCVMLQPPLPSLNNRSSSPTQLGSLADNVRPASVPIILAPSPSLARGQATPASGSATPPEVAGPISREEAELVAEEECPTDTQEGQEQKSELPKASVYDI